MIRDNNGNEIFSGEPTHPGEMLSDELEARGMTQKELARAIEVSATFVSELVRGKKSVSLRIALKLETALAIDAEFWVNAQRNYNRGIAYLKAKNELKQLNLSPAKQKSLLQAVA
ncbi:HigA family addiction module antidote protein [Fibrella sp. HMF5335]|uniref:HigA family addiction module antidote protein n=1 Tax=Fibrella rubiginis TaxID=2817060 RepID=A0A939K015_9BACT|nr:HigA family addiction module antitoxin [Fibrella rubiginis]MBO0935617.1 HigA family addiction module antidote protein [Fibrella rubiginis]